MSAITGLQQETDYIQIGSIKFPLPIAPPGEQGDWGLLHTSPMEPFSSATVAGDDTIVSDDRIAQIIWSDMRRGIGLREYIEAQGTSGCQDSDLDLSMAGIVTLPPLKDPIGEAGPLPASFGALEGIMGYRKGLPGAATWILYAYSQDKFAYFDSGANTWTVVSLGAGVQIYGFAAWGNCFVFATSSGIFTGSTINSTFINRWAGSFRGLAVHDNKLYTYNTVDQKIYWTTGVTVQVTQAWPSASAEGLYQEPGELVWQLLEWRDSTGARSLLIVTDRRLYFYADQDYFSNFWKSGRQGGRPQCHVWARDDLLYQTNYPYDDTVMAIDHQSVDDASPNKDGGIGTRQRFAVSHLAGNNRTMFAFCPNRAGASYAGRTLRASEAFGWSTLNRGKHYEPADYTGPSPNPYDQWDPALGPPWDGPVKDRITGGAYGQDEVLTVFASGRTEVQRVPDRGDLAYYVGDLSDPDHMDYEPGPLWHVSSETDCGLEQIAKLAAWFRVNCHRPDGAFGLPAGDELYMSYEINGTGFRRVQIAYPQESKPISLFLIRSLIDSALKWPLTIPLPATGGGDPQGVPFVRLRWAVGMKRSLSNTTPILRSVALHYLRAADVYDGLQVPLDFSDARFRDVTGEEQPFYGLSRADLLDELEALKQGPGKPKRLYPVTIGFGVTERTYASCDIRVTTDLDPSTGYGHAVLTIRDVSAPPPGVPFAT